MHEHNVGPPDIEAVDNFYIDKGFEPVVHSMNVTLTHNFVVSERVMQITDRHEPHITASCSLVLVSSLTRFKPGTVLADKEGHY